MKKIFLLLLSLPLSTIYSQTMTITSNDIESIYTEAIDARFAGDLPKSRFLLENLKENNHTNEYVMTLLLEVYTEYVSELIQQKDQKTFHTAYPGIRENIADIWDMFPNSKIIQDLGLKLSILTGDQDMGKAMASIILEKNPFSPLANYIIGISAISQKKYTAAIPYLKKVIYSQQTTSIEQYIYKSILYLGDIYLEQNAPLEALEYYQLSTEYINSMDTIAKIAVLEAYKLNIPIALEYLKSVPYMLMSDTIFNVYIATLWLSEDNKDREILNTLLSTHDISESLFLKAITQAQLGRTQKAISLLRQETIMKTEFPGLYYSVRLKLMNRIGQKDELFLIHSSLGQFHFQIKQNHIAKSYLQPLDRTLDTNGSIATVIGTIAQQEWDYNLAQQLFNESLNKSPNLYTSIRLIEVEQGLQHFTRAESLINELEEESFWKPWLKISLTYEQNKLEEALTNILEFKKTAPAYPFIDQLSSIIYLKLKDYSNAEKIISQVYNHDPHDIVNKNLLAYFYAETKNNLDTALSLALEINNEKTNDIIYLDTLAWVYTQREEYTEAQNIFTTIESLLQTLPFVPNSEEIYAHMGYFYNKIGNTQKSLEYLEKGLSIDSNDVYIQQLQEQVINSIP